MSFNSMQQLVIQQRLGFPIFDEQQASDNGMYIEDDMLEFFCSGDRLWLVGGEIQVIKYGEFTIPVEISNQEFKIQDRNEFTFPSCKLASALTLFLSGNT